MVELNVDNVILSSLFVYSSFWKKYFFVFIYLFKLYCCLSKMNMKQLIVILFCLLMSSEMLWAGDGNHYDYTPKSPEAAAFDRVPDIPVSNYTGTLALSIPIYTITCGDIILPKTQEMVC